VTPLRFIVLNRAVSQLVIAYDRPALGCQSHVYFCDGGLNCS